MTKTFAGFELTRPLIMGIVNATPDSFSDGGMRFASMMPWRAVCS